MYGSQELNFAFFSSEVDSLSVLNHYPEMIMTTDLDLRILWANQAMTQSLHQSLDQLRGHFCYEIWAKRDKPCINCPSFRAMKNGKRYQAEKSIINGKLWHLHRSSPMLDAAGKIIGAVISISDITDRKQLEDDHRRMINLLVDYSDSLQQLAVKTMKSNQQLRKEIEQRQRLEEKLSTLAIIDDLTGLYNRRGFYAAVEHQLKLIRRDGINRLLFYLDLDHFKSINDRFGHQEGDRALLRFTEMLRRTFRESDIVARLSGDEFAILAMEASRNTIELLAKRLAYNIQVDNRKSGALYQLAYSLGVVQIEPTHIHSVESLLEEGDRNMYQDKKQRKQMYAQFGIRHLSVVS